CPIRCEPSVELRHHRAIDKAAGDGRERFALGQLELGVLQIEELAAEQAALAGIGRRDLNRALHFGRTDQGYAEALPGELFGQLMESAALLGTQQVPLRDMDIVEKQFGRVLGVQTDFLERAPAMKSARPAGFED